MRYDAPSGIEGFSAALRALYSSRGYSRYRMGKFEEYALYGGNLDFLISDRVITFTDTNGKLMALKPDVTLSIVKHDRDDASGVRKVCYDENVYRVSKGTGSFKEIMQSGLECIGDVDGCLVGEVLTLAAASLVLTGARSALDVSHLGLLSSVVGEITDDGATRSAIIKCVGEKNMHDAAKICREAGASDAAIERLVSVVSARGSAKDVATRLSALDLTEEGRTALCELVEGLSVFEGTELEDMVTVDLSVTADPNYYNGVVFKGFVEGIPESVLSGGQYDRLMEKLGRRSRAVGFAVYIDLLERLISGRPEYDVDVMLVYGEGTSPRELAAKAGEITESGRSVFCCRRADAKIRAGETIEL